MVRHKLLSVGGLLLGTVCRACSASPPPLTVDLGYAKYTGYQDENSGLNNFRGIRYADSPAGLHRWDKPHPPPIEAKITTLNASWPPPCPQTPGAPGGEFSLQTEDCLFLSVIAPPEAKDLPVLVFIHGGGYGGGGGNYDFSEMINNNAKGFVFVGIQYRLGAFGFLSSAEIGQNGVLNAGLLDQEYALNWVQQHIGLFGGDPSRVTLSGQSAGAGSVMSLVMARGGALKTALFQNVIVASPYLPHQWNSTDLVPTTAFNEFAAQAGCAVNHSSPADGSVLQCLRATDSTVLQEANYNVTVAGHFAQWTFTPTTDGTFLSLPPSKYLAGDNINGARILSGNNAAEGYDFVPANINSEGDFTSYLKDFIPLLSPTDLATVAAKYAIAPVVLDAPKYSTQGDEGPSALNQSFFATGQQQRADNIYAETVFVCPSYWLASAFSRSTGQAWKYQFSVPGSQHSLDLNAYYQDGFLTGGGPMSQSFRLGMQKIWGGFIINNDPTLPADAVAALSTNTDGTPTGDLLSAAESSSWLPWDETSHAMLDLNATAIEGLADYRMVDGYNWESERGARCDFWAANGALLFPE